MRKIIIGIILIVQIIFIIPIIFTKPFETKQISLNMEENTKEIIQNIDNEYDYGKYQTIKLLHQDSGVVEELNLDEYLCNVVSAEMPVDYNTEALKAQAIVARTYTIYKINTNQKKHDNADICDSSDCCQAWISKEERLSKWDASVGDENWKKIEYVVYDTKGKIITYDGEPINAFFHSNSGGKTEIPINVWGGSYAYLQTVETYRRRSIFSVLLCCVTYKR